VVGGAIAASALAPEPTATGVVASRAAPTEAAPPSTPLLRHGVVGAAAGVNPLTAATRTERDLAALVFAGLVRLGPDQTVVADLAARWDASPDGRTWTFELRDDARWHDGAPVVARDVTFTVDLLGDPEYAGPAAASWRDVSATAVDELTVRFELETPIGGFLEAARQPILPSHLLVGVPVTELANHPFNSRPIGAGPYRLVSLDAEHAVLEPAAARTPAAPSPTPGAGLGDPLATPPLVGPVRPPDRAADLDVRFFPDVVALTSAWQAGEIDLATGLPPDVARRLAARADSRLLRYPTSILTAVILNVRPDHPELRDPAVRRALLEAIDRSALLGQAWDGQAALADAPIPPVSWLFDGEASPAIPYDRRGAAEALGEAGWTPADEQWIAPGGDAPYTLELLSPDVATNPAGFTAGASVAADWRRIGLTATHVPLPPGELVGERLRKTLFTAAVVDVNVGLDPDLYPLLASSQTTSRGLNLGGVIDADLDRLLEAARAPGSDEARRAAYRALQERLATHQYALPLAFRDELVLVRDTVSRVTPRQVADAGDRFWDVLAWRLAAGR